MYPLLKNNRNDFFGNIIVPLRPKQYTIVVLYLNGYKKEYSCIEHPWRYIEKVKKNPKVKNCYIK
jgi:hypothetical protein